MTDYLGAPRFRVTEIEGYSASARAQKIPGTGFTIVDRAYCCAIVWSDWTRLAMGPAPVWVRRSIAHAKCAVLNAKRA